MKQCTARIARIYQLNKDTGEIIKLIQELNHDYPLGSHERQEHSHVHYINETPDCKYVVATDLGTDRVVTYEFSNEGLKEYKVSKFKDQDGPRHIAFHNNGEYAYIVHELSNYVSVAKYKDGQFEELERHLTVPQDFNDDTKLVLFAYRMINKLYILVTVVMIVLRYSRLQRMARD